MAMLAAVAAVPCAATGTVCSESDSAASGRRFALPCRRTSWRANPGFVTGFSTGWRSKAPLVARKTVVVQPRAQEQTYVMVKPDGVQRGLVGEIISRFERKGFQLKGLKLFKCPEDLAKKHYEELQEKPFFPKLVKYIISGPVVCMAWEGPGVVASARKLIGSTNPLQAEPGTIRGDLGIEVGRNVVHGSDSPANGGREIALWFREDEIYQWQQEMTPWLRE